MTALALTSSFDPSGKMEALPRAVSFLKVLGHEGRLEILCHLIDGERNVSQLTEAIGVSQPAVSQHLMRLRAEGLVSSQRRGKSVLYSIARPEITKVVSALRDAFCAPNRPSGINSNGTEGPNIRTLNWRVRQAVGLRRVAQKQKPRDPDGSHGFSQYSGAQKRTRTSTPCGAGT